MSEERGEYRLRPRNRDHRGVEHISDLLRDFVDEQGWDRRLLTRSEELPRIRRDNGRRRDG